MDGKNGQWSLRFRGMRAGIVVGAALALAGLAVGTAAGVDTPFQKVLVVNAPASPIPVTGTINVGNAPSNQTVTVSNFPATQPVSGTVSVGDKATKFFRHNFSGVDADFGTLTIDIPGSIDASALTLNDFADDSMDVAINTGSGQLLDIHSGEGFSRDFTLPVPITSVEITCTNNVLSCSGVLTVWGT
jgi:hypothetical protein